MQVGARPLGDVLGDLDNIDDDEATIFVKDGSVDESTESLVLAEGDEPPPGFKYLLEVFLAKEVIEVWSKCRGGKRSSLTDRVAAVAHYASHDAYRPRCSPHFLPEITYAGHDLFKLIQGDNRDLILRFEGFRSRCG